MNILGLRFEVIFSGTELTFLREKQIDWEGEQR